MHCSLRRFPIAAVFVHSLSMLLAFPCAAQNRSPVFEPFAGIYVPTSAVGTVAGVCVIDNMAGCGQTYAVTQSPGPIIGFKLRGPETRLSYYFSFGWAFPSMSVTGQLFPIYSSVETTTSFVQTLIMGTGLVFHVGSGGSLKPYAQAGASFVSQSGAYGREDWGAQAGVGFSVTSPFAVRAEIEDLLWDFSAEGPRYAEPTLLGRQNSIIFSLGVPLAF